VKVFIASPTPSHQWSAVPRFLEFGRKDRFRIHELCHTPEVADIILLVDIRQGFVDWKLKSVRDHPLVGKYSEKVFVFNEIDYTWCGYQGLYTSLPASSFDESRARAVGYPWLQNEFIEDCATSRDRAQAPDLLFSFMGSRSDPIRSELLALSHDRAYVQDTSEFNFFGEGAGTELRLIQLRQQYAQMIARSRFVLCPRGAGTSSFRLFETLAAGRVPVIISDEWVPPKGPDWSACSLRVREAEVSLLIRILEQEEKTWEARSVAARRTWLEWFASDVVFHRFVEACVELKRTKRLLPEYVACRVPSRRYARILLRHSRAAVKRMLAIRRFCSSETR